MKTRTAVALVVIASTAFVAARASSSRPGAPAATVMQSDLHNRDVQIAVWKKALAQDTASAIALGQLAALYMQRGRESGDESNYRTAEEFARRSVKERENRNGPSFVTLAAALVAQHNFVEAAGVADKLVELYPDVPQYRSMRGEIEMELGKYDDARRDFANLWPSRTHLSIAPRLARYLEVTGHPDDARNLLRAALHEAELRRDLPREQLAWFHLRVGDMDLRYGRPRSARIQFDSGLVANPRDYRLLAAMSRLEFQQGDARKSIEYGEQAMDIKLDPATLGIIGDAYAATGDTANAEDYFKTMEVAVAGQPGAYHRAWSLFLLDHNRRVGEVLANVTKELETRRDIYGYDLYALALFKSGQRSKAREAIAKALSTGSQDPLILGHARMIDAE